MCTASLEMAYQASGSAVSIANLGSIANHAVLGQCVRHPGEGHEHDRDRKGLHGGVGNFESDRRAGALLWEIRFNENT